MADMSCIAGITTSWNDPSWPAPAQRRVGYRWAAPALASSLRAQATMAACSSYGSLSHGVLVRRNARLKSRRPWGATPDETGTFVRVAFGSDSFPATRPHD